MAAKEDTLTPVLQHTAAYFIPRHGRICVCVCVCVCVYEQLRQKQSKQEKEQERRNMNSPHKAATLNRSTFPLLWHQNLTEVGDFAHFFRHSPSKMQAKVF